MSFKWKMSLYISMVTTVILVMSSIFVYFTFTKITREHTMQVLDLKLKNFLQHMDNNEFILEGKMNLWAEDLSPDQFIRVTDSKGELLYSTNMTDPETLISEEHTAICAETLFFKHGSGYLTISLYQDARTDEKQIQLVLWLLAIGTLGGVCIAAISSYIIARTAIKPIQKIVQTVKGINMNNLAQRLSVPRSKDEIHELSQTFNHLLERVENGFELQQQFAADASHEFRTPLTAIEGHANLIYRWGKHSPAVIDESITYILLETSRMKQLTTQLLVSASTIEEQKALAHDNASLLDNIEEVKKQIEAIYEKQNSEIQLEYAPILEKVKVKISKLFLQQILVNVLENAVKYTSEKSKITIHIGIEQRSVQVTIQDNGIGIGPEDLPNIFERFYRANKSRNKEIEGVGLGLSITKRIIESFGGQIHIQSDLGVGTFVTLQFLLEESFEFINPITA
jgi:two-component system sensor histidine kinase ArlS